MSTSSLNEETPLPAPTAMEQAALTWCARCQRGLSAAQAAEFQDWLAADRRHPVLFNEFDGTWALLGHTKEAFPVVAANIPSPLWRRPVVRLGLSIAAAITLGATYLAWWRPAHFSGELSTAVGALQASHLPDGSLLTLNTDSAVAVAFTPDERRLKLLRGEVHFAVAKNAARPFVVEAAGITVQAVGTAFKIQLRDKAVEVLVTEGKVRVNDATSGQSLLTRPAGVSAESMPALGDRVLTSGQKLVLALPPPVTKAESPFAETNATAVSPEEIKREFAWQERRLDFGLATLGEIVAEFNRYHRHKLVIADAALAQKQFGGSFKSDDQTGFVRRLRENFDVTVEETEAATVLRAGP